MSTDTIKSARRALGLFELFAEKQRPLSIKEIAVFMGVPQSSTSVLVKSLVTLGYLEHDQEDRCYYPTLRIALLGTWMRRRHKVSRRVPTLVSKLATVVGESVLISIRNGIYTQHVYAQKGEDPLSLTVESGQLYPLATTASGWMFLSRETDEEVGKIIRRTQAEVTNDYWRENAAQALENVQKSRHHGYAITEGHTHKEVAAVAVLLPISAGKQPLTLCVGGPTRRIHAKKEHIVESMSQALEELTQEDYDYFQTIKKHVEAV